MEKSDFCKELKKLRKDRHYTQKELAKIAGVSKIYINLLENGKRKPSDKIITKLCKVLNVEENILLITIGKIKMDIFGALAIKKENAPEFLTKLSDEEWKELINYLAYMKIKASIQTE